MIRPGTMLWGIAERVASRHGYDVEAVAWEIARLVQHTKNAPKTMLERLSVFEEAASRGIPGFARVGDCIDTTAIEARRALLP